MFYVDNIGFAFEHNPVPSPEEPQKWTRCFIYEKAPDGDSLGLLSVDYAYCHTNDNFCRATGRKIALTRALDGLKLDKETRQKIWKTYFEKVGKK